MHNADSSKKIDKKDFVKTLAKTLPDDALSVDGIKAALQETNTDDAVAASVTATADDVTVLSESDSELLLDTPHLSRKAPDILSDEVASAQRYELRSLLGSGGMGKVYAVEDLNLQRDIAIKSMKKRGASNQKMITAVIREARITASLEHSGVLPVHDLDFTENGEVFYSMRQVKGMSLEEAIRQAEESNIPIAINTINDRINLMLKVCDTLELAHSKHILHRDIKPANIMLGNKGDVFVVDWGTALLLNNEASMVGSRVGTPIFMSPEQSRREAPSVLNEVYSVGATLFQLLTLRFHMFADSVEEFWEKKKTGAIDPFTTEESSFIPEPLQAILLKALAANEVDRYQSIADFADDLRHYQSGLALSAFTDTAWGFLKRWCRRNKRAISVGMTVAIPLLIVLALGLGVLFQMQAEQSRHWDLIFEDRFDRQELGDHWEMVKGHADIIDDKLHISGDGSVEARLLVPHSSLVRLEFEAMIPAESHVCDMSAYMFTTPGVVDYYYEPAGYLYGFGVGNNSRSVLRRSGQIMSERADVQIEQGKWHHVVCEKDVSSVRLIVDGVERLSVKDHYPPRFDEEMYVVLYTYKSRMQIRSVKLFSKTVAERSRTIDIADEFFWSGDYKPAARLFQAVWQDHGGTQLGNKALYSLALCRIEQERYDEAMVLLDDLLDATTDETLLIAARFKKAYAQLRAGNYQEGLMFAKTNMASLEQPEQYSDVTMFFDESFRLLKSRSDLDKSLLLDLTAFCDWWIAVFPEHPSIRKGRFFQEWSIAYRRAGDWEHYQRILNTAINAGHYDGGIDRFKQMLFRAQWRGQWTEERLAASEQSGFHELIIRELFAFRQFDRLRTYMKQLETTEAWGQIGGLCKQMYRLMLECEGDVDALRRGLGSDVLTPAGRLHMARCYAVKGNAKSALEFLDLNWEHLEERMSERNPIGHMRWRIAFSCFAMLNDRDAMRKIQGVAERLRALEIVSQNGSWYHAILSIEDAEKMVNYARSSWEDHVAPSAFFGAAESYLFAGDKEQAVKHFEYCLPRPFTFWSALAQRRLQQSK